MKLPTYERQNKWMLDYLKPLFELDFGRIMQNYKANRQPLQPAEEVKPTAPSPDYPAGCTSRADFVKLLTDTITRMDDIPQERQEALIESSMREWLPRGEKEVSADYARTLMVGIQVLLGSYARRVSPEKRLHNLQRLIEKERLGPEYDQYQQLYVKLKP